MDWYLRSDGKFLLLSSFPEGEVLSYLTDGSSEALAPCHVAITNMRMLHGHTDCFSSNNWEKQK